MSNLFKLHAEFSPAGDQPAAITALNGYLKAGAESMVLRGVTGSGKTCTLANVIAGQNKPVLILSHNKTLAAQLYGEFKGFFPENAVEYFISYYDYYLPESYIPATDTYIAKDASINDNLERLRLSATSSLLERRDVIVVASVSCIYGLGSPADYAEMCLILRSGSTLKREALLERLVELQFSRNDTAPEAGQFRVRGDSVDIFEPQKKDFIRVNFWGDEIEQLTRRDPVSGKVRHNVIEAMIYPCKQFVMPASRIENAIPLIKAELKERVEYFERTGRLVEAQRIYQRVTSDIEMMKELGYTSGIENYSYYLSPRPAGSRPFCLLDYFPDDFLLVVDESHVTIPQIGGMSKADRSRKETLVEHGFRLPSALENRPLFFDEFKERIRQTIYVSATPGAYETEVLKAPLVEQIIRPTGLPDPVIDLRPLEGQIDDVLDEIRNCVAKGQRVLVTTLTKKNAERLSDYLSELGVRCTYLHSELDALERVKVLARLREGHCDCLIGINLLREGLDLPEVGLVAILDADKEGFLRSERSLIQVAGRAARNVNGRVILYGDTVTPSMDALLKITAAHRKLQLEYNRIHNIVPRSVVKSKRFTIAEAVGDMDNSRKKKNSGRNNTAENDDDTLMTVGAGLAAAMPESEFADLLRELEEEMLEAAEKLEFERAAFLRDRISELEKQRQ